MNRKQVREVIVKSAKDSNIEQIAQLFLAMYADKLEHLKDGDHVDLSIPVGKEKFFNWLEQVIKQYYPTLHGLLENEATLKMYGQQIADSIAKSNTAVVNPLRDYKVSQEPIYVKAEKEEKKSDKKDELQMWSRYSPKNPGVQLERIGDGIYQDPTDGEIYKINSNVKEQSSLSMNNNYKDIQFFLDPPKKPLPSKKNTTEENKYYDVFKGNEHLTKMQSEQLVKKLVKQGQIFQPTIMTTRQCPDHPGQQTMRIDDNVRKCPLDDKIYDFTTGFTTEDGEKHNGGSVDQQNSIVASVKTAINENLINDATADSLSTHGFLWGILKFLPHDSVEKKILDYKFSNNISLDEAIAWFKKAQELTSPK